MTITRTLAIPLALCLLGPAYAQTPPSRHEPRRAGAIPDAAQGKPGDARRPDDATAKKAPPKPRPLVLSVHDIGTSRRAFLACDKNCDDRLVYLEAKAALPALGNRARFRSVDRNGDGVIHFAEFDRYFRDTTRRGGELRIAPKAAARLDSILLTPEPVPGTALRLFAILDIDGNDRLDLAEWKNLAQILGRDPNSGFLALDKDLSGGLTVREVEAVLASLNLSRPKPGTVKRPLRPLPPQLRQADVDGNSLLDPKEIERALAHIHPTLTRHTAAIIAGADRNGDGKLHRFEVLERLESPPQRVSDTEVEPEKKQPPRSVRNNR